MNKIIINFTPTGMLPSKEMTPMVPISVDEIIEDVQKAYLIGITMVHLHARDDEGVPTYKKDVFEDIILGIREFAPELIICVSTSGRFITDVNLRSEVLDLEGIAKPDMASLTLGSVNFAKIASINSPEVIQELALKMKNKGILPELEVFDLGMMNYLNYLDQKDIIKSPFYINIILGNIASAQMKLSHIGALLESAPNNSFISIGGVGNYQLSSNSLAISLGLGVRCGIEDNYWYDKARTKKATNSDLIERLHKLISANDSEMMTSMELRTLLNLETNLKSFGLRQE